MSYREFTSQGEYELPELSDPQNPLLPQCFGNKEDSLYKLPWSGASLWFSAMYPPNLFVDGFRVALVGARVLSSACTGADMLFGACARAPGHRCQRTRSELSAPRTESQRKLAGVRGRRS